MAAASCSTGSKGMLGGLSLMTYPPGGSRSLTALVLGRPRCWPARLYRPACGIGPRCLDCWRTSEDVVNLALGHAGADTSSAGLKAGVPGPRQQAGLEGAEQGQESEDGSHSRPEQTAPHQSLSPPGRCRPWTMRTT